MDEVRGPRTAGRFTAIRPAGATHGRTGIHQNALGESPVAKGQKKSNKEVRKPKAEKPKTAVSASSFSPQASKKK